jgi:hypothetical protein
MSIPVADWGPLIGPSTAMLVTVVEDALEVGAEPLELHADITTAATATKGARRRRRVRDFTAAL